MSTQTSISNIQEIPQDVLLSICSLLNDRQLSNLGMVNRFFGKLSTHEKLWKPRTVSKYFRVLFDDEDMWYPTMCYRYSPFLNPEPRDFSDNVARTPQQLNDLVLPSVYQSWKKAWIDLEYYKCWRCFSATKAPFDQHLQVKFCPGCNRVRVAENAWTLLAESSAIQIFGFSKSDIEELVPSMVNGEKCYHVNNLEDKAVKLFGSLYNTCNPVRAQAARAKMKQKQIRKAYLQQQLTPFSIQLEQHVFGLGHAKGIRLDTKEAQRLRDIIESYLAGNGHEDSITRAVVDAFSALRENELKKCLTELNMEHLINQPCCQEFIQQGSMEGTDGLTLTKVLKQLYWHVREPELLDQLKAHRVEDFDYKSFAPAIEYLEGELNNHQPHTLQDLMELIVLVCR